MISRAWHIGGGVFTTLDDAIEWITP